MSNVVPRFPPSAYALAKARAKHAKPGDALYPRVIILADCWCVQRHPAGEIEVLTQLEAEQMLIAGAA